MVVYLVWTDGGYVSGDNGECRTPEAGRAWQHELRVLAEREAERVGGWVVEYRPDLDPLA